MVVLLFFSTLVAHIANLRYWGLSTLLERVFQVERSRQLC